MRANILSVRVFGKKPPQSLLGIDIQLVFLVLQFSDNREPAFVYRFLVPPSPPKSPQSLHRVMAGSPRAPQRPFQEIEFGFLHTKAQICLNCQLHLHASEQSMN